MGNSCFDAFQKGQQERARYPLRSGLYKLREARRDLIESLDLLDDIRNTYPRVVQGARGRLKSLPKLIAHELGWNIVPAVEALTGDKLPSALVKNLESYARGEANALLPRLDELHDHLSSPGIDLEIFRIKCDNSGLERLLTDAVRLIDRVLAAAAVYAEIDFRSAAA